MSRTPIGISNWPTARGTQAEFKKRHGKANSDRFGKALRTGDPLADALVATEGERATLVSRQLQIGLLHGLDSLDDPDELVAALLQSTEPLRTREESALVSTGPRAWCTVPYRLHLLSMSAGALISVYSSSSIASVLTATGRLQIDTERRLLSTARWLSSTMLPGSLARGEPGYVATVRLRLSHARARRSARAGGHDEARFGIPINQVDLAHTWLAFTLGSMRAQASLGFKATETSVSETYRYWHRLARLLGIDDSFVASIQCHADAEELERMIGSTSGMPGRASVTLTEQTLATVAEALDELSVLPASTSRKILETIVRRIHGDTRADELEVGATPGFGALLSPVTALAMVHRATRRDPIERWSADRAGRYADALRQALSGRERQSGHACARIAITDANGKPTSDRTAGKRRANDDRAIASAPLRGATLALRLDRAA